MDMLSQEDLRKLVAEQTGWCVSLYMPMHHAGPEAQEDRIRMRNLLSAAEDRLVAHGLRSPDVKRLLAPAEELHDDSAFWRLQSDGLAVFVSPAGLRGYRLPYRFAPTVTVGRCFLLKPLLPLLSGDGRFYLLALSQNEVRLLAGSAYSIAEVDLQAVPGSLAAALKYDDPERQLQFHAASDAPGSHGEAATIYHGHADDVDEEKTNLLRFFHQVDDGLHARFRDEHAPLVLAGVEYLLPIYRKANTYPYLVSEGIEGNPEHISLRELHRRAWSLVQPAFAAARAAAAERYRDLAGTGKASGDLQKVMLAARYGRVEVLLFAEDVTRWGTLDADATEGRVEIHETPGVDDVELLDLAAMQTLLAGGTVYPMPLERMPGGAPVAAVFRY